MQSLTRDQLLELVSITGGTFDQMQHTGHVALAFGTPFPSRPGWYLDLDAVALAMLLGLTQFVGRAVATAIIGGFCHQWLSAVGHAEADPEHNYFLAIGGIGWNTSTKGPDLLLL